jgi:hypothetical protein
MDEMITMNQAAFAEMIMECLELDEDVNGNIVDNGTVMMITGKTLKTMSLALEKRINYGDLEFNPLGNVHLMTKLFNYFLAKVQSAGQIVVNSYYPLYSNLNYKKKYELKYTIANDPSQIPQVYTINSRSYKNDSICLYELILILQGWNVEQIESLVGFDYAD